MSYSRITRQEIIELAHENGYEAASLMAVIDVESSGHGYSSVTGEIIIQFEPNWFKRKYSDWKLHTENHTWDNNGVSNQTQEWIAFSDALRINSVAAMEATSIGMMQVMGFHWKLLKFKSVQEMWAYAKLSERNQVEIGIRFIKSNSRMNDALEAKFWATFAYYYNGTGHKKYRYDTKLAASYAHYKYIL